MATYKRVNADQLNADLKAVADTIRAKTGSTESLSFPSGFVSSIEGITGGGSGSVEGVHFVTFMNGDEVLYVRPVADGDTCADVVERGLIPAPTKESTTQYDYYFDGWGATPNGGKDDTILNNITANKTVYAIYSSVVRTYTITYYDDDGTTVLNTQQLAYGATPSTYIPEKDGYTFVKWTPSITTVKGDTIYTAVWEEGIGGTCGNGVAWELSDGALVISGSGAIEDYTSATQQPWAKHADKIVSITIGSGITTVGSYAFYGLSNLTTVTNNVTDLDINSYAFSNCKSFESINSKTLKNVGDYAFDGCDKLGSILYLSTTTQTIGKYAFRNCTATRFGLKNANWCKLSSIGEGAFYNCSALTDAGVYFSTSGLGEVGNYAFYNCSAMTTVKLGGQPNKIGKNAFTGCSALTSATFGKTSTWKVSTSGYSGGSSVTVTNTTTNVTYLTSTYENYYWNRT